ncbi:MAG: hypothetical protein Crog4KO_16430 [Crocinitomicaceae bacterium]
MNVNVSIFDLLIIIGMVTGVICSVLLMRKAKKKPANMFLVFGILGFVWLNTKTLLLSLNLWEVHGLGYFPNGIELALPPLFYFYAKALLDHTFSFSRKDWLHFVPFFLSQTYAIVVYVAVMQTGNNFEKNEIAESLCFVEIKHLEDYLTFLSTVIYLSFTYIHNKNYKRWLATNTSDTQLTELGFIKTLTRSFIFIAAFMITNLILNNFLGPEYQWRWKLVHLIIAGIVYYMALVGYKNSDNVPTEFTLISNKKGQKPSSNVDLALIPKLNTLMKTDQLYLNPKLTLQELANHLQTNEVLLSNSITAHFQKNFRGYINSLRVDEVKNRLQNDGLGNLSLLGLAKECGFNSEASFYRIFRANTGVTPKQFLDSLKANSR